MITAMSLLDWIIVAILIISTLTAARNGLIVELFSFGGLLLGIFVACWHYQSLLPWIMYLGISLAVSKIIAFIVIALFIMIFAGILGRILRWSIHFVGLGWLDRIAGAVFGLLEGAVLVVVVIVALLAFQPHSSLVKNSQLTPSFLAAAHDVAGVSPADLSGKIRYGIIFLRHEKNQLFTPKPAVS